MAVVMYAGGFARFFLGDWPKDGAAAVAASASDDEGLDEDDLDATDEDRNDAGADAEEDASPADVQVYFESFRAALGKALATHLAAPLSWSEDLTGAQQVAFVSEADFGALMMIAARGHVQKKRLAPIDGDKPWYEDPAVLELQDADADFLPVHHLIKADTWLPAAFKLVAATEVPERDVILGSLPQLVVALADVERVLRPGSETIRKLPAPFVAGARQALAVLQEVAGFASTHGTPALIDRW